MVNCNENGRKLSKRVENTEGKGEIASNFSFSNSVFNGLVLQTRKNQGLFGKGLREMVKLKKGMNNVSFGRDMTKILLTVA